VDNPREAPFASTTGRSSMTIPWISQRRIPAHKEDIVHRDMFPGFLQTVYPDDLEDTGEGCK
jgi:hypothetical protein